MSDEVARYTCSMKTLEERGRDFSWTVKVLPDLGRSCFATRTIEAGETLAYDEPLLWWEETPNESKYANQIVEACRKNGGGVHDSVVNYLAAYASASTDTKARIADFMHVTTAREGKYIAHMRRIWTRIADDIWSSSSQDTVTQDLRQQLESRENIVAILTKSHLNAHTFGQAHVMLEIASKFNHSCSPNASYNKFVDPSTGKTLMRIFTIKRILEGEEILSTYIGGQDMLKPTRDRRRQLMLEKAFWCTCFRCTSPDPLAPLPCPSCRGTSVRYDEDEWPWHCLHCHRRWWDAEISSREGQLQRLLDSLDRDMSTGRVPPLQIVRLVVRDTIQDLKPHHHLVYRARTFLDEVYAFRAETHQYLESEHLVERVANAYTSVDFLTTCVWTISPVVATNLAVRPLRTLLGRHAQFPSGVPKQPFERMLLKTEAFLRSFWGQDDADAALFRKALYNERICQSCKVECVTLVVCGSCASAHYCSRTCQEREKSSHLETCQMGQQVGSILHSEMAY